MTGSGREAAPPAGATLLAAAAVAVAAAVGISEGMYDPISLALVTAATGLVALSPWAASLRPSAVGTGRPGRWPARVLAAGIVLSLGFDALYLPGILVDPARLGAFRPVLGAIALLCATHLWPRPPPLVEHLRFPGVVAAWLVLAALVLRASPAPGIDVWRLQQAGAAALAHGDNPYAVAYPNPYGPGTAVLAPEILSPDRRWIRAYPYTPLNLVVTAPSAALGDVRLTHLVATAAAAALVFLLGRRSRAAELAATFLLVQPRTLMVIELSWTEPVVLAAVAALAVLAARAAGSRPPPAAAGTVPPSGRTVALGLAAGLALASKQYAPLLLLPFWPALPARGRGRVLVVAAAAAAAFVLPFLAWNPEALWRGLVRFQLAQPFRPDALSWLAAVVAWGGPLLPTWPSFVLAGAASVLGAVRARSVSAALAAGALAWLLLVTTNKQAFANYYWLAVGLLCAAVAAGAGEGTDRGSTP